MANPVSVSDTAFRVDWLALSPQAQDTIRLVVVPLALGYSHKEIGDVLGIKKARVQHLLGLLRKEIRAQIADGEL